MYIYRGRLCQNKGDLSDRFSLVPKNEMIFTARRDVLMKVSQCCCLHGDWMVRRSEEEQLERSAVEKTHEFFSRRAAVYDFAFFKLSPFMPVVRSILEDRRALTSNMKVLDAGAGTGLVTRVLYSFAKEKGLGGIVFHAFDLTRAMLDVFQRWIDAEGAENAISTRVQDVLHLETLPPTWTDYDLIVTSTMLEYVPPASLDKAVAGLLGLLKPGGKMIWLLSGRTLPMRFFVGWLWRANLYSKSELDAVLAKAGAANVEYLSLPRPYPTTKHLLVVEITRP
jgi:SAM-dependent methyltransferase